MRGTLIFIFVFGDLSLTVTKYSTFLCGVGIGNYCGVLASVASRDYADVFLAEGREDSPCFQLQNDDLVIVKLTDENKKKCIFSCSFLFGFCFGFTLA